MLVAVCKVEKKTFDLHVATIGEKLLQSARTQVGQAFHQFIDLVKTLAVRQFIQQFEDCAFRRGKRQRASPLAPRLNGEVAVNGIGTLALVLPLGELSAQAARPARDGRAAEELAIVVIDETNTRRQFVKPVRR